MNNIQMSKFNTLVRQHDVWRARDFVKLGKLAHRGLNTGYDVLDDLLYDRGWPKAGLVEILCDRYGIGELRLLTPALAKLSRQAVAWVVWINPPFVPYAPALSAEGIDIQRLLLIYPDTHKEALWALEETLCAGSCKAVLAWLHEDELTPQQLRRIQTQARQNGVWATLFRPQHTAHRTSAAELRLRLDPVAESCGDVVLVSILKRRGGWSVQDMEIRFPTFPLAHTRAGIELVPKGPISKPMKR